MHKSDQWNRLTWVVGWRSIDEQMPRRDCWAVFLWDECTGGGGLLCFWDRGAPCSAAGAQMIKQVPRYQISLTVLRLFVSFKGETSVVSEQQHMQGLGQFIIAIMKKHCQQNKDGFLRLLLCYYTQWWEYSTLTLKC